LLVRATYIWVLFFTHIPFDVNRTFNATPTESWQFIVVKGFQLVFLALSRLSNLIQCETKVQCTSVNSTVRVHPVCIYRISAVTLTISRKVCQLYCICFHIDSTAFPSAATTCRKPVPTLFSSWLSPLPMASNIAELEFRYFDQLLRDMNQTFCDFFEAGFVFKC